MSIYSVKKQIEAVLGPDVRSGRAEAALEDYQVILDEAMSVDTELLTGLLEYALDLEMEKDGELDQWLAPRVHFALRLPRRIAGDRGFWTWLTLKIGMRYTLHRWGSGENVTMYRYTGDFKRNALSRLWWFAEMARNGPSYADVQNVLRDASTAQYAMELKYSMYRPAVIAFGRVAAERTLGFEQLKSLSKRINAYLSLRSLEAMGLAEGDGARDAGWWSERPILKEVIGNDIQGPQDAYAAPKAIEELAKWFNTLVEAPRPVGSRKETPELAAV
jgi:uncharacterized protein DUF6339